MFDARVVVIALVVAVSIRVSWRGLFRDPLYEHEPAWIRLAFLAVWTALYLGGALWMATRLDVF